MGISLHHIKALGHELLFSLCANARREEVESVHRDTTQKDSFLRMQFDSRDQIILEETERNNSSLAFYVERFNPAFHLNERPGFRLNEDKGACYFMK